MADVLGLEGLGQISLFVRDLARAERFYGLVLGLRHLFTYGDLAFFDLGGGVDGTRLYLHRTEEADWRPGSILYFRVRDLDASWDELGRRGVERGLAPHRIFTHPDSGLEEWMASFQDGEGNVLELMALRRPGQESLTTR
jgi:catechol 2,3-dioxygenase-like lactoylglutathione lyase family enzyme